MNTLKIIVSLFSSANGLARPVLMPKRRANSSGGPKKMLDTHRIAALRAKGVGWKRIAAELGVGVGTIYRVALDGSKTREKVYATVLTPGDV